MTEIQVISLIATLVGFAATVLNLVAFLREKDRSHTRAGLRILVLLALMTVVLFLPRLLPGPAHNLHQRLPAWSRPALAAWLNPTPALPGPNPVALQGTFSLDLQRNLLGGIDCLMARFQLVNVSALNLTITGYRVRFLKNGQSTHSFQRLLPQPWLLTASAHAQREVELDPSIRDVWVEGLNQDSKGEITMEITWEGRDSEGRPVQAISSQG